MVSDGIENCILYFNDYNPNITKNPFAYFTQVIYFAFLRRINKEEKNRYIIYKNFQETIINNGHAGFLVDGDDNHAVSVNLYDNINDFMAKFEKKEAVKKEKRKMAKEGLIQFYEEETDEQRSTVSN
jgi:DNA-binding transcriptional regulator/RsmH inhibitor MraZ